MPWRAWKRGDLRDLVRVRADLRAAAAVHVEVDEPRREIAPSGRRTTGAPPGGTGPDPTAAIRAPRTCTQPSARAAPRA